MLGALARARGAYAPVAAGPGPPLEADSSCPAAWAYETSAASRNAVCCSRRAGKTVAGARRAVRVLTTQPGAWVHVVSLIRRNARKHFWRPIKTLLDSLDWRYKANETEMLLELSNGSWLQCVGCDDSAGTKAVQGDRSSLFVIDECHLPNDDVLTLLVTVAEPMLVDTGGMLDLLGLPPEVEPSFFSDALDNPRWAPHHWDMFSHDLPRPAAAKRAEVEEIIAQRGLTWEHPLVKRQYLGQRARDPSLQAYEYLAGRNDYDPATVDFTRPGWVHSAGLDLGYQDRDALVVLAWRLDDERRRLYVRFAWQRNHLSTDSLAHVVAAARATYHPIAWTYDTGGHGAVKIGETLRERFGIDLQPKPAAVDVSLGLVNDDLRTGRLLLPTSDTETPLVTRAMRERLEARPLELAAGTALLTGEPPDLPRELVTVARTVDPRTRKLRINTQSRHVDISEALRYAHHGAQAWRAREKPVLSEDEKRRQRRAAANRRQSSARW